MDDHENQHDAAPPPHSDSMSGADARYLRAGISAFIVVSVVGLVTLRAYDYWARTHGSHAVPVEAGDALASYLPAAVVYLAVIGGAVYLALRRRRAASTDASSATSRS